MINFLSFDIEEWFQAENLSTCIDKNRWDNYESRVVVSTEKILGILRGKGIKASFFVLGWVAERAPDLIKEISQEGHEIASHGYAHELVYNQDREKFKKDILRSKDILESIIHKEIIGYRAPCFSITPKSLWALDVLKECGFKYDSSIFATSFHDRYGQIDIPNSIPFLHKNGLAEFPIANFSLFKIRLPLGGGGYFRLFPYIYFNYFFKKINAHNKSFVFYLHPWEFDAKQPILKPPYVYKFRHYVKLNKTELKLEKLLNNFKFQPFGDFYKGTSR